MFENTEKAKNPNNFWIVIKGATSKEIFMFMQTCLIWMNVAKEDWSSL